MGASSSSLGQDGPVPPSKALHVLRVSPGSPAAQTDIDPFFDFVIGIDKDEQSSKSVDAATLGRIVEQHEGKELPLVIWSAKYRSMRVVPIIPSSTWSQEATKSTPNARPSLLGLTMRVCSPEHALENVWHILEVLENSPAESAGLVPYGDWVIGWSGGPLSGENAFYGLVEAHIDKPLRVVVYSYDFDTLREVVLVPNRKWGGEGLLGCGVGYGLLHRIPPQPVNQEAMDTILRQNLPYDEQDAFRGQNGQNNAERTELFVPADDENFEFGGESGQPKGFDEPESVPSAKTDEFDETPVSYWHTVNKGHPPPSQPDSAEYRHRDHSHGHFSHSHDHDGGHSSHSHTYSPTSHTQSPSRSQSSTHAISSHATSRRTGSMSSVKSIPKSPASPPPRSQTPTQSGVPTLSHTFSYREARNSLNGIIKPEPLRKLGSPPMANAAPKQKMRGGIVHSPAHSGAGTPTRVKSPEMTAPELLKLGRDGYVSGSDGTRQLASPGGSITSVD